MDETALARVEDELYRIAEKLGQPESLDNQLYRRRPFEGAAEELLPTKERITEKLYTLQRLLSLHDRTTYTQAMQNIRVAVQGSKTEQKDSMEASSIKIPIPDSAILLGESGESEAISFADLPDLAEARAILGTLIKELGQDDGRS